MKSLSLLLGLVLLLGGIRQGNAASAPAGGGGSSTTTTNVVTISTGSIAVTNGANSGSVTLYGTNGVGYRFQAAPSNSVPVTNMVGLIHRANASVIVLDANQASIWTVTNRIAQATTLVVTNLAQGQEISCVLRGEVAGGTSRVLTIVPQLGFLVMDLDAFGAALAVNKAITLTNGNGVEINLKASWIEGTNFAGVVTRQYIH